MVSRLKLTLLLTLPCVLSSIMARETPIYPNHLTLPERLAAGGIGDCWDALMQLKSCSNEILLFFLNGDSYLGMDCCRAIRVITLRCWPTMLSSIGFTAEEGDILRGYCDASASPQVPSAPPPVTPSAAKGEFVVNRLKN